MKSELNFHHVGTLVDDMGAAVLNYTNIFGMDSASDVIRVASQQVDVCFIKVGSSSYIELVCPYSEESKVFNMLKKRVTYYHIGYKVDNITLAVAELEAQDFKAMEFFSSEAFDGKRCIFLFSPDAHLFELIEA
ncbi:MAG: VOC family protein [Lentimicrobium sp.]|jgi:catechol 2,3-dioxygenase-like lactoylglutathione lyase family enzyme|nr:VOC family protein [Lentimicrobium sp.]